MADTNIYPQIPSTVWSGVWQILHDSPSRRVDDNVLAVELGVQKTAAKQYLKELQRLGLFSEDNSTTDLAKRWRQDGDDPQIIKEILDYAYPTDLRDLAPQDRLDREKIARWFVSQGLGAGAAQNKAGTYIRVASGVSAIDQKPNGSSTRTNRTTASKKNQATASMPTQKRDKPNAKDQNDENSKKGSQGGLPQGRPELNVNVQIHISADSTSEQINAIFAAMRRYFDGSETA